MAVKVLLTVYENKDMLQLNLECLRVMSEMQEEDIVIIDMGTDREIKPWLENQSEYSFICAEGLENFAEIINTAISEFSAADDVMLLNSNMICLGDCISRSEKICMENECIGAVIPADFTSVCPEKTDISGALDVIAGRQRMDENTMLQACVMPYKCVYISHKLIEDLGQMEESLLLPSNVMLDYSFRGICRKWRYVSVPDIFVYEYAPHTDIYAAFLGQDADHGTLRKKWGMNYFNEIPNEQLIKEIKQEKDDVFAVLEVGCDCGVNLMQIGNRFSHVRLSGLEINPVAADIASGFGEIICGNIEDYSLPFEKGSYDYILFGDVLEHLQDPEKVIIYCKQFLKPQGRIIASIPNLMHYSVLRSLLNGDFTYQDTGLLDKTHIHFFTYNEITRMFSRAGYEVYECSFTYVSGMLQKDKEFVIKLKDIHDCETFMYLAYQYLVVAGPRDETDMESFLPQFRSDEETIRMIVEDKKSLGRFGDGEFSIAFDIPGQKFQRTDSKLRERIRQVITQTDNPDMLVGIAANYGDLGRYNARARRGIEFYLTEEVRKQHMSLLSPDRVYSDAYITRPYVIFRDAFTEAPGKRFDRLKTIWNGKNIIIVEGAQTRLGIGNDLFGNAASIRRIIAPAVNSFDNYDDIYLKCMKHHDSADLFLLAIGPSSGVLAYDLSKQGIQAVDVGHIDLEYEWFRAGKGVRVSVPGKYNNELSGGDKVCDDGLPENYYEEIIEDCSG